MKSKVKFIIDIILSCLYELYRLRRVLVIISLIPLAEAKAIFYHYDYKIKSGLFYGEYRWVCNVVEDYANVIIFGTITFYIAFLEITKQEREVCKYLFILTVLDLFHLGLMDMQYLVIAKIILAYGIYLIWSKLKVFY